MPAMHLVNTVLPAPLSPHSAVTCPDGRSRLTWYRAWTGPKCLSRSLTWSSGSLVATGSALAADISPALSTTGERRLRPPQGGGRVGRGLTPPHSAAASGVELRDVVRRADRLRHLAAEGRDVDELVLDHGR